MMNEEYNYYIVNTEMTASTSEKIISILIWPLCFLYASMVFENDKAFDIMFGIFVLLFITFTEILYWNRKNNAESLAMLVMTIIIASSVCFSFGNVWEKEIRVFFAHLYAVYWVLCRSDRLAEGETSHMMVWDGIVGFFVMPFKHFLLNAKTIFTVFRTGGCVKNKKSVPFVLLASFAAAVLFFVALSYLMDADDNYNALMQDIGGYLKIDIDYLFIPKVIITVFASTYLYGLLGGCYRETKEQTYSRGEKVKGFVEALRKVPGSVWVVFIGFFSLFYAIFFIMQGHYLFDAFIMKLPQEFTYSQYARKGFGDMCGVMVVNFILFWLSTRTVPTLDKPVKIASFVLNVESMFFALIAFLKIAMYINAYGFTPLRFESIWAATVLMFACVCVMINMLTGRKMARIWFMGSAATLTVLCII